MVDPRVRFEGYLNLVAAVFSGQSTTWFRSPCGVFYLKLLPRHSPEDIVGARLRLDNTYAVGPLLLPKCRTCGNTQTSLIRLKDGEYYEL